MLLLEKGANSIDLALIYATENSHYQVVQLFLERVPKYNLKCGSESLTPTNTISVEGHMEVARLYLSKGADIKILSG